MPSTLSRCNEVQHKEELELVNETEIPTRLPFNCSLSHSNKNNDAQGLGEGVSKIKTRFSAETQQQPISKTDTRRFWSMWLEMSVKAVIIKPTFPDFT